VLYNFHKNSDMWRILVHATRIVQDLPTAATLKQCSLQYQGADFTERTAQFDSFTLNQLPVP
jgi:hypothetical protein